MRSTTDLRTMTGHMTARPTNVVVPPWRVVCGAESNFDLRTMTGHMTARPTNVVVPPWRVVCGAESNFRVSVDTFSPCPHPLLVVPRQFSLAFFIHLAGGPPFFHSFFSWRPLPASSPRRLEVLLEWVLKSRIFDAV